jgi:hypothetical protein
MLIRPLIIALAIPAASLFSQHYIDVTPEKTYVGAPFGRDVFELGPGLSLTRLPDLLPEKLGLVGNPRVRVRFGKVWVSNGNRLLSRNLDAADKEGWKSARLPEGLDHFGDFEIVSADEALLCGAGWQEDGRGMPLKSHLHFVFNHRNGAVKRVIEELDSKFFLDRGEDAFFGRAKESHSVLYGLGPKILIVGQLSGFVTIFDRDSGGARKIRVVPEDEMPLVPEAAVNDGFAIPWVGPLEDGSALVCCKKMALQQDGSAPRREYFFRTLDVKTGRVTPEGGSYRGFEAKPYDALFERDGELRSARDVMAGHAEEPEDSGADAPAAGLGLIRK